MTMKVAKPAFSSVPTVVPRSLSLKNESSPPRAGGAVSLLGTSVTSASTDDPPLRGTRAPDTTLGTGAAMQPTPGAASLAALFGAPGAIGAGRDSPGP